MGVRVERKGIYISLWVVLAITLGVSYAFGALSLTLVAQLNEWEESVQVISGFDIGKNLVAINGCLIILIVWMVVLSIHAIFTLTCSICAKRDATPGFRYGAFAGMSLFMIAICIMTCLVLESSKYLVDTEWVEKVTEQLGGNIADGSMEKIGFPDADSYYRTLAVGYATAALYFLLFVVLVLYQLAMGCGCFKDTEKEKGKGKENVPATPANQA